MGTEYEKEPVTCLTSCKAVTDYRFRASSNTQAYRVVRKQWEYFHASYHELLGCRAGYSIK